MSRVYLSIATRASLAKGLTWQIDQGQAAARFRQHQLCQTAEDRSLRFLLLMRPYMAERDEKECVSEGMRA